MMTDHEENKCSRSLDDLLCFNDIKFEMNENSSKHYSEYDNAHNPFSNYQRPDLPKFNKKDLNFWFVLVESEFRASKVFDDDVKFNAVLRALDENTARQLADIIEAPIKKDRYKLLKGTILERFKNPRQSELNSLLKDSVLGEKKPSELLREMRILARDDLSDGILHELWLERLPGTVKPLLAMSEGMSLTGLAEMADRIMLRSKESLCKESNVSAASFHQQFNAAAEISTLKKVVNELRSALTICLEEVKNMQIKQRSRSRTRSKSRSRSSFNRSSTPDHNGICWYHSEFGSKATKCGGKGCKFESPLTQGNSSRCQS